MKTSLTIIFTFISFLGFGCINEYRTVLSGKVVHTTYLSGKVRTREIDTIELRKRSNNLFLKYNKTDSIEYLSDYAASLVYLGEYERAKLIYLNIEKKSPNLYTTASNLGTVYELINKPDSALHWITKSVKINPDSHYGSEWIHIKILEFKLANNKDFNKSILGLEFGSSPVPENVKNYDLSKLQYHIKHQLKERTYFVKPPDKIVGNIYFDYGNILAQTENIEVALESYQVAKEYSFESVLMNDRIEKFESLSRIGKIKVTTIEFIKSNFKIIFFIGLIFILAIIGLIIYRIIKRKYVR